MRDENVFLVIWTRVPEKQLLSTSTFDSTAILQHFQQLHAEHWMQARQYLQPEMPGTIVPSRGQPREPLTMSLSFLGLVDQYCRLRDDLESAAVQPLDDGCLTSQVLSSANCIPEANSNGIWSLVKSPMI